MEPGRTKTGGRKKGTPNKATAGRRGAPSGELIASRARESHAVSDGVSGDFQAFPTYRLAKTDSLIPYENNARTHTPASVDALCGQIRSTGWTNPILVAGKNILAGHRRRLAAIKLGLDVVPVIDLSHLTAAQRRAYILWDNKSALDAGWDADLLRIELSDLRDCGFDLDMTGFSGLELAILLEEAEPAPEPAREPHVGKAVSCPSCGFVISG